MPLLSITADCPLLDSFRVRQVAGMFDVPLEERLTETFEAELPGLDEDWEIGLIVGPSGSGKSTLARRAYGESYYVPGPWPEDKAVIDCLGELPAREIARLFSAVGLGSPPSWIKPYHVLSNGEKFRCDLARAIAEVTLKWRPAVLPAPSGVEGPSSASGSDRPAHPSFFHLHPSYSRPLLVFDEFTSVVDRTVAKVASAAIAKLIRNQPTETDAHARRCAPGRATQVSPSPRPILPSAFCLLPSPRFIAVSCHHDIANWLSPDWVLDMATGELSRRRLRRPDLRIEVFRCAREAWSLFARHHYLSGALSPAARCFLAVWDSRQLKHSTGGCIAGSDAQNCDGSRSFASRDELRSELGEVEMNHDGLFQQETLPVSFCATLPAIGRKGRWRVSRLVTLPDYQGIGIGTRLLEAVAELHAAEGHRMTITASHPGLLAHCARSPRWKLKRIVKCGTQRKAGVARYQQFTGRSSASFEFAANAFARRLA